MKPLEPPYYPIVYIRGYAGSDAEADDTAADPYMGFNLGSTVVRQEWTGKVFRQYFESPLVRLMKDHGYRDVYEVGSEMPSGFRVSPRSIFVYRYYDIVSNLLGTGERATIEYHAKGLGDLIRTVRDRVCADEACDSASFRVYLVAHSMGGLVARAFLQNPALSDAATRALVDKVFTYATPHNGIDLQIVGNVPGFFSVNNANNFDRDRMREYLALPEGGDDVADLNGAFDPDRFFCLVGTNDRDYDVAGGIARRAVGPMSDGLVRIRNAAVAGDWAEGARGAGAAGAGAGGAGAGGAAVAGAGGAAGAGAGGAAVADAGGAAVPDAGGAAASGTSVARVRKHAPRAFVHRSHSGHFGIVNSEDGYQNLTRFLFGDYRVDGVLLIHDLPLPPKVERAHAAGKRIRASYHFDVVVRVRGARWDLHRRLVDESSAVFRTFDDLFPMEPGAQPRHPHLFSTFVALWARKPGRPSLGFSVELAAHVPEYEVDGFLMLDDHYPGGTLYRDKLNFELNAAGQEWRLRWGTDSRTPNRTTRPVEEIEAGSTAQALPGFACAGDRLYSVPIEQKTRPGIRAELILRARAWT